MSDTEDLATQWRSISHLLDEALLLSASERRRWLAELPAAHAHLRDTLEHFLQMHARLEGDSFLESPAVVSADSATPAMLSPGDSVGPYRVIEELGTGGMGSVWLAERADGKPRRRVALKLPRMVWASDLSARMEQERDILASLEHPNIARLYDAGLDEQARPYLAIEYVEGVRITHYCQEQKLDIRGRVELFIQVLAAIQYAHTRLVLHRDLKPGNILVNREGEVRLLDFGIAKLVQETQPDLEADAITMTRALTPRYASPEQLRGERLTLVSDVYSLGVILHELLTGLSPYPATAKGRAEVELAVMEGVSTPPSRRVSSALDTGEMRLSGVRLARELRGELDAIVLKSLSLDIPTRYASVEALASDLDHWLNGRPVQASSPSVFTIVRKFVLRNRLAVFSATIATLAILAMSGVALHQAKKATAESQRAAATRDFLIDMFESANPELHDGREATVRELVSTAERALNLSLSSQPLVQAEMLGSLVNVWLRLGDQRRATLVLEQKIRALKNAGESDALLAALIDQISLSLSTGDLARASDLHKRLVGSAIASSLTKPDEVTLLWQDGWIRFHQADYRLAIARFSHAERLSRKTDNKALLVNSLYGLSLAYKSFGDWDSAARALREAREYFDNPEVNLKNNSISSVELLAAFVSLGLYKEGQSFIETKLGGSKLFSKKFQDAISMYELALSLRLRRFKIVSEETFNKAITNKEIRSHEKLFLIASLLIENGDFDRAKKIISVIELSDKIQTNFIRSQIAIRRLKIAISERDFAYADMQVRLLQSFVDEDTNESEVIARVHSILGVYWFSRLSDKRASTYLMKSAATYKKIYGSRHPKFLEVLLAYRLVTRFKPFEPYQGDSEFPSNTIILEGLEQAYPKNHPIVGLAESLLVADRWQGGNRRAAVNRQELLKGLLILS